MIVSTLEQQARREGNGRGEQRVTKVAARGYGKAAGNSRDCSQDPRPGREAAQLHTRAEAPYMQTVGGSSVASTKGPRS